MCAWSTQKNNPVHCPSPVSPTKQISLLWDFTRKRCSEGRVWKWATLPIVSLCEVTTLFRLVCKPDWVGGGWFVVSSHVYGLFECFVNGKWLWDRYWLFGVALDWQCFSHVQLQCNCGKICFWHVLFDKPVNTCCLRGQDMLHTSN